MHTGTKTIETSSGHIVTEHIVTRLTELFVIIAKIIVVFQHFRTVIIGSLGKEVKTGTKSDNKNW